MPQIVYQPPRPNSLNNLIGAAAGWQAGREQKEELERRRQAFELDKQRAEFELATAKQEQARKIESEDAYKQGVQWAIKYAGKDKVGGLQEASTGGATKGALAGGPIGAMLGIATSAQEKFAQHEKQKLDERQAIASRMHDPRHAEAFMQMDDIERQEERILFERDRLLGDLGQWMKNDPNIGGDEAGAQAVMQTMEQLQSLDPRDPTAAKAIDQARQTMTQAIVARTESEATGRYKVKSLERALGRKQQLEQMGELDAVGSAEAEAAIALYETLPVQTRDDAIKYTYELEDALTKAQAETTRRSREGAARDKARADPTKALRDIEENVYGRVKKQIELGVRDETGPPPTEEEMNAEIVAEARRAGLPEESFKHLLPQPSDIQRLKQRWSEMTKGARAKRQAEYAKLPGISTIEKDPGKKARVYRFLADLKIQGKTSAEVEQALAEKFKMKIDTIDMAELQRVQEGLQAEPQGRGRARQRQMEGGG